MFQPLFHRLIAPRQVLLDFLSALALVALRELQQPLGGVRAAVEKHVLHTIQQLFRDLIIDLEQPCIDDSHVHSR